MAGLTALMGLVNLLSVTTPGLRDRVALLRPWLPLEIRFGSHLAATLAGFALLLLAGSLARRKRAAWSLTLGILLVSAVSHLLKGLDWEEAGLSLALAAWLVRLRPSFHARSDKPSVRQGLWVAGLALVFTPVYGVLGLALLDHHFSVDFDLWQAARQVVILLTQFDDPGLVPITPFGHYFADSITMVAAATMGYALLALVRPVLLREAAAPAERERARLIVEAHGRTSLAWFALTPDKSYYFSPGGSVIAFVVSRRVCLAAGDVIGPPADVPAALAGFREFCAARDWQPAFVATEPDYITAYQEAGWQALCIGHEAIVPVRDFTLAGGRSKDIRGRVARLSRLGYTSRLHPPPLSDALLSELRAVSDDWLDMVRGGEKGFFIGAFEDDYIRRCPVMAVYGPDGRVRAFGNLYPEFQRNEATVDLMRRTRAVENGTMEMLFVSLFEWAKKHGYDTFNLGLSPLAGVGQDATDPSAERALGFIFKHSQQYYNFKGLYQFKSKFHPAWSARYLIYPGHAALPAVAMAVVRAHAGEDFLWKSVRGGGRPLPGSSSPPPAPPEMQPGTA